MQKKYYFTALIFLLFFYLLRFPQEALEAVSFGLSLWYRSVLPVLFPFMILSGLMVRLQLTEWLPGWLLKPVCRLFRCSADGCFAILIGFLCGFPMGAKVTHDLRDQNRISEQEAAWLYGFVNNVSPAFLFSFLAYRQLGKPEYGIFFLACVSGSSLLYALMTRPAQNFPAQDRASHRPDLSVSFREIDACIQSAVTQTVHLGAYITVFSLLGTAANRIFPSKSLPGRFLAASLEITTGISFVVSWNLPLPLTVTLLGAVCAFGGFSAFAQTVSIASMDRKTALSYLKSRVIITLLAVSHATGILLFSLVCGFLF